MSYNDTFESTYCLMNVYFVFVQTLISPRGWASEGKLPPRGSHSGSATDSVGCQSEPQSTGHLVGISYCMCFQLDKRPSCGILGGRVFGIPSNLWD